MARRLASASKREAVWAEAGGLGGLGGGPGPGFLELLWLLYAVIFWWGGCIYRFFLSFLFGNRKAWFLFFLSVLGFADRIVLVIYVKNTFRGFCDDVCGFLWFSYDCFI